MLPTCKVEAYGVQKEFGTEIGKLKLPFPFVPHTLLLYTLKLLLYMSKLLLYMLKLLLYMSRLLLYMSKRSFKIFYFYLL